MARCLWEEHGLDLQIGFHSLGAFLAADAGFLQAAKGVGVVIAGVCMAPDTFEPSLAINKELELKFSMAFSADEFRQTMHRVFEGELDVTPMISRIIGLDDVPAMFDELLNSPRAAEVLVDPRLKPRGLIG